MVVVSVVAAFSCFVNLLYLFWGQFRQRIDLSVALDTLCFARCSDNGDPVSFALNGHNTVSGRCFDVQTTETPLPISTRLKLLRKACQHLQRYALQSSQ